MAEFSSSEQKHPALNLSTEEQRLYSQVFSAADSESIGVVTGDVALRFLPDRTKLPSEVLGEIWQIADVEDKGFLTPAGFYIVLRLVGYAQAGKTVSAALAVQSGGPLPKFEGINSTPPPAASPLQAQGSGGPIRVPPLGPDNANKYSQLFQQSGAQNGTLSGTTAKQIFDRAQLPNDILVRIWNLADTEQRGLLSETEFIIAMHLLASFRSGSLKALPHNLPAGLYEAAARRGVAPPRPVSGTRPQGVQQASVVQRHLSGSSNQRPSSPLARQPYTPASITQQTTGTGSDWVITPQEKERYDGQFDTLDTSRNGVIGGEQAVGFFSNSGLPEEDLATIWDLSDMKSAGQLTKDEFAVAMYLIRQQLAKRGPLPTTLPANLIPPSMRSNLNTQQQQQQQPPTPQSPPPKAKSAADDLFGLDALAEPPAPSVQVPQSTGGSSVPGPQPSASPQTSQPTVFKPFVPTSAFGQSIISPQQTGTSQTSSARAPVNDDLLGDTDPEVNKKITGESSELGNLSNQVTNLSNQMQDVKNKRVTAEQNMSQAGSQKRDFETRLSQLRSAYEQEARELRGLEEKLAQSRHDTKKIQSDFAMVQHSYTNLQEQRQQVQVALEADQKENATLKEQMKQINTEITQLKPQIEKMRSEARQHRGLVAINKKQLSTNESERDRVKAELESANKDYEESSKELEDSGKELEQQKSLTPLPVASPAASTTSQSTNPFFRRTATGVSQAESARSPFGPESTTSPNHSAFDSFFATSMAAQAPFTPPTEAPPTSFGTQAVEQPQAVAQSTESLPSVVSPPAAPLASESKPVSDAELPPATQLPPPPPQSRQITSSSLPLREPAVRSPSETSSTGVAPPSSRFGEVSGLNTPVHDRQVSHASTIASARSPLAQTFGGDSFEGRAASTATSSGRATPQEGSQAIPGSFPGDSSVTTPVPGPSQTSANEDPFATTQVPSQSSSSKDDFDSAFEDFDGKGKQPETTGNFPSAQGSGPNEFPPIQEFDNDDDDSSDESDKGFDDNFSPAQNKSAGGPAKPVAPAESPENQTLQPEPTRTDPPTPNAQASPPDYEQVVVAPGSDDTRKDSNQFPPEFSGLLPAREDPTSPETTQAQPDNAVQSPAEAQATGTAVYSPPTATTPAPQEPSVPAENKAKTASAFDDFDDAFGDLSEAKAADEKGDEDFPSNRDTGFDDFNPTFDSPAHSKTNTSTTFQDNAFTDFGSRFATPQNAAAGSSAPAQPAPNHDWDAMFAGLDSDPKTNGGGSPSQPEGTSSGMLDTPSKPSLTRAISTGTEHDDPILKRLTAMGYPRDQSLAALEKFDYNLDKAADFLTSGGAQ